MGIITSNVYIYIYIDNIYIGIVTCQFFKFITVMALNWSLNFVSAQYLQDTCTELGEILHMLWLLPVSFLQLATYGLWVMPIRIPFPLDIVRTNGWNFTQFYICIYIGKILDGILPVGLHKFVTELWTLIDIFTTWFSEFNIAEACWPILFTFYVYRQKGSGQLNTIWGQLWAKMDFYRKW